MWSNILDRISFWSLFATLALLPVFFLPFTKIPIEIGKGLLLIVGLAISVIFYLAARFSDGKIILPKSWTLVAGGGVVLAILLSALFSSAREMSFFGTMFDVGTFWFIFAGFLLMFLVSIVFRSPDHARKILWGIIIVSGVVLIFQFLRLFAPSVLSFGVLAEKTDNFLGSWNALGFWAGFTAILSLLIIEFFQATKAIKWLLVGLIALSLFFVFLISFPLIWGLLGFFALLAFIYKISFFAGVREKKNFPAGSLTIMVLSLLFFTSGQFIAGLLPNYLRLPNTEVRPSFSSTALVAKSSLTRDPILGLGPNRFGDAWAMHRPAKINNTPYWNTIFDSGVGMFPTFFATTGLVGILAWLLFFVLFIIHGGRSLLESLKDGLKAEELVFFVAPLFLFIASFFYPTGSVIFLFAMATTGIFIGLSSPNKTEGWSFFEDPRKSFFFILLLVVAIVGSAAFSFKYLERFASVSYFGRALAATNISAAETSIQRAVSLSPNDLYWRTYAQVYLLKLNTLVNETSLSQEEQVELQRTLREAVNGATSATVYNRENFINFQTLGAVYDTLGSFGVPSAYGKAIEAYQAAEKLNPLNPAIKLALSRDNLAFGKIEEAKSYADRALSLKADYIDALVALSQIARADNNLSEAIRYAEGALTLAPGDEDLTQYLDSLKSASNPKEEKR